MAKRKTVEDVRFENALHRVLSVSKAELNTMLAQEQIAKVGKPKPGPKPKRSSASDRAFSEKQPDGKN